MKWWGDTSALQCLNLAPPHQSPTDECKPLLSFCLDSVHLIHLSYTKETVSTGQNDKTKGQRCSTGHVSPSPITCHLGGEGGPGHQLNAGGKCRAGCRLRLITYWLIIAFVITLCKRSLHQSIKPSHDPSMLRETKCSLMGLGIMLMINTFQFYG